LNVYICIKLIYKTSSLFRNQAKQIAADGKKRPVEVTSSTVEEHIAKKDDHDKHHREQEQARLQLQGHDEGVRRMQTRSQANPPKQKAQGIIQQPGGGARGK
jgi:hypothetical protein